MCGGRASSQREQHLGTLQGLLRPGLSAPGGALAVGRDPEDLLQVGKPAWLPAEHGHLVGPGLTFERHQVAEVEVLGGQVRGRQTSPVLVGISPPPARLYCLPVGHSHRLWCSGPIPESHVIDSRVPG